MKKENNTISGAVYSTEFGRMCPVCGRATGDCVCRRKNVLPEGDGVVRVSRETKGRRGKAVTLVAGVPLTLDGRAILAKQLKRKCGSGGTIKDDVIELQGDHRDVVTAELKRQGYRVKRV